MSRPRLALLAAALLSTGLAVPALTADAATAPKVTNGCVTSVPDAGSSTPQKICYTLFQPAGSSASKPVPLVFHSHGWAGSRTKTASSFTRFLDAGYGVLSFDQRGFGEGGGKARIENPDYEGKDVAKLVDLVSKLSWVQQDGPGDPRIGAIGGSYGGGYQFVGAFTQIAMKKKQVFDALAPEITWWSLKQSLAPLGVPKTQWDLALTGAGARSLPPEILQGFAQSAAMGTWSDGSVPGMVNLDAFFVKNGPQWQTGQGRRIDVPVLFGQGTTDQLFPLEQGLQNFAKALTPAARAKSIFVGYNGGHVLPNAFPLTVQPSGDPCSKKLGGGSFQQLTVKFFNSVLKKKPTTLSGYGRYHIATAANTCTTTTSVTPNASYPVGTVATPELAGPGIGFKVADGPLRVAGTPYLSGKVTALGVNNRAFFALAIGSTPLDAKIVQGNMLPWSSALPVNGEAATIELPSVAVDVPEGQSLFVVAAGTNDMYAGFGSRTPGVVVVQDAVARIPVVA